MTATDELRRLLDERGVEWWEEDGHTLWYGESTHHAASAFSSFLFGENERVHLNAMVTPAQAIAATLGDSDATGARRGVAGKVYLVEESDELIEGWCPLGVYLSREAAGKHAESLRGEVDGVMSFARVVELKVVGE